ncbi:metal ABC transporter solute-binding protein, Zn/Mn family [Caldalkalibacillus mannanilyticus]|uniref:metal ABC transporter solute-binding protein, Zn/Mn family n=1 Tax=Caldalkalibacillus mannanilyticus TaxID=1418 RepID=UPI00046A89EB|nr:zinc ABC transporter substrate-binding protein [Caldalkalibacillus mannanilyticus]
MKKKAFIIIVGLMVILSPFLVGCANTSQDEIVETGSEEGSTENKEPALLIYTSMYPLYDFASKIAGDRAVVVNLVPAGSEPHDYDPTPKDVMDLSKADLFIYNGGGFESWIEKIVEATKSSNPNLVLVDTTANIQLLSSEETGLSDHAHEHEDGHDHDHHANEDHHDHAHESHSHDDHAHEKEEEHAEEEHANEEHGHDHGEFDPHVWLDPLLAKEQAEAIKNAIVELNPENKEYYENNFSELALQFDLLHSKYEDVSQNISIKDMVVSHAAFGYLAQRYGINQIAIAGLDPTNEPSAKQLKEIVEYMKKHQLQYVMFENLVTPKVAEVVRTEVGAEALILHNLEGLTKEEQSQGKDYFSIMEENLESLKLALGYNK